MRAVRAPGYSKEVIDYIRHEERKRGLADVLAEAETTPRAHTAVTLLLDNRLARSLTSEHEHH